MMVNGNLNNIRFEDKIHGKGIYIEKNVLKYEGEWYLK